ncbi:MAG: DUF4173 domain-containing protein [Anaerolineales bacterium]
MTEAENEKFTSTGPSLGTKLQHVLPISLIALALGLAVEILFFDHPLGISFPLWVTLSMVGLLAAAYIENVQPSKGEIGLGLPILFLSWMTIFRAEPFTAFLGVAGAVIFFAIWIRTFRAGMLARFGWLDFTLALVWVPIETWLRPWATAATAWRQSVGEGKARSRWAAVLRGVLLALPALILFTALLAAADAIFGDLVEKALKWLNIDWLLETFARIFYAVIAALVSLGALVAALIDPHERRLHGEDKPLIKPFLGFTESAIILGAVDILFLLFVMVQFRYFFGGEANITAAGYTYSEYARRGFGELVTVAFLSLGMILLLGYFSKRESDVQKAGFNVISALLVGMLGVMLVSALQRLLLYENAYGFTRLRTYTHIFIPWLAALLVTFVVLLFISRLRRIAPLSFLAGLGFVLTMAILSIDAFIVERNIERYKNGEQIDVPYLVSLSTDAVPRLASFAREAPIGVQEELLPQLACTLDQLQQQEEDRSWQSFSVSRANGMKALRGLDLLRSYEVERNDDYQRVAIGPNGEETLCVYWYGWD